MEEKIGSIETRKLADLVVLDRDYFTVPDVEIKKIRSVMTIVDGKIVHDALKN
jgi:predicted amidohydrolase YtcJ